MLLYKIMAVFGFTATKLLYLFYYFLRGYWSASTILKRETLIEKLNKIIWSQSLILPPFAHVNTSLLLHSPFSRFAFNDVVFPYNRGVKPGLSLGRCTWLTLQTVMCSICHQNISAFFLIHSAVLIMSPEFMAPWSVPSVCVCPCHSVPLIY